ncbi:SAVED domain-containing protein [Minwuia sp.]|uniref:SAVED domain-containing protein n=1 Tax=Minwuia sp. TaxID=2493630 RepID=UPI003A8C9F4E
MTQAVSARRDGDTFQARQFWLRAGQLLDAASPIVRVGFESGPKSYDDVWTEYADGREPKDASGNPLKREHIQSKWHATPGTYGYADLTDPDFINANARSLLQRARDAQLQNAPLGSGAQFKLVTNWHLDRHDNLNPLISQRSGSIRLDRLFGTRTDNSKAGRIRKSWRDHLELDDDELRLFAGTLAFGHTSGTLDELRGWLDILFASVGLRRVPAHESAFFYDDLIFQWMAQGRLEFDEQTLRAACTEQGLFGDPQERPRVYGVKSFEHAYDRLENRCDEVLNLVPAFDKRFIHDDADWSSKLYPELATFLHDAAGDRHELRLALDAHSTLAFAAGRILDVKSGRRVELEQRTPKRDVWSADDVPADSNWPGLEQTVIDLNADAPDIAVAIGITHYITDDVRSFLDDHLPSVGRLLSLGPSSGAGYHSVEAGRHAFALAQAAKNAMRSAMGGTSREARVHIFVAAPNALTFFLGQQSPVLGRVSLYEFDFEGSRDRTYRPSLSLPVTTS